MSDKLLKVLVEYLSLNLKFSVPFCVASIPSNVAGFIWITDINFERYEPELS